MTIYECSKCGVISDSPVKCCTCDAPIIASIQAACQGSGGLK